MTNFVLAHGAWSSAWAWRKMRPRLRAAGHALWAESLTGLGARAHLSGPEICLETHIADVLGQLHMEDLTDVVLIGHSYGGMVATGVADRARDRVARLIYLDAFAPEDGQSAFDISAPENRVRMEGLVESQGSGWRIPPNPMPPDTAPEDVAFAAPRRVHQPVDCFRQKLAMQGGPLTLPIDYIYCTMPGPGDGFRRFYDAAPARGWGRHLLEASHNPHITCPDALTTLLLGITADTGGADHV
jgi:pimeloyl-ACP methyl ester carboxylesterase